MGLQRRVSGGTGIFIGVEKIHSVEQTESEYADINLKISFDIGKDFTPIAFIGGKFKRDENTNEVIDWGGAFVVSQFLEACKVFEGMNDDEVASAMSAITSGTIPPSILSKCNGKKVLTLKYMTQSDDGKTYSRYYKHIWGENGDPDRLKAHFLKSVEQGYTKNYVPDAVKTTTIVDKTEDAVDATNTYNYTSDEDLL